MFSSQDEDEDEESAFESVPDGGQTAEGQEMVGAGGERRTGRWKEARRGEPGEPAVAGPSDRHNFGETKHSVWFSADLGFVGIIELDVINTLKLVIY